MKNTLKIALFTLFIIILNNNKCLAQTQIPMSGTFVVNGETFNCRSWSPKHDINGSDKILVITNARSILFPVTSIFSTSCPELEKSKESRRYGFAKNKLNTMQISAILKTVFPPQRCIQLNNRYFEVGIRVMPNNNNVINWIEYVIHTIGIDTYVTQEEIAQLDFLIRTTTHFTFPKSTGMCNNVSSISIGSIPFDFNELYTTPYFNGTDTMWDEDE